MEFQKFFHNDLSLGHDPKGWDTQRKTEPLINFGYEYSRLLASIGHYHNDWAGQLTLTPSASLGNLFTAAELELALRVGWNIAEGFIGFPAPPGRGLFQASQLPKPSTASPYVLELFIWARGCRLFYSVIYDGSFITDDDRYVDRNNSMFAYGMGLCYHHYDFLSIRMAFQKSTDLLKEKSIPDPLPGRKKTSADVSFGSLIVEFHL
jgi:hypothetical protein